MFVSICMYFKSLWRLILYFMALSTFDSKMYKASFIASDAIKMSKIQKITPMFQETEINQQPKIKSYGISSSSPFMRDLMSKKSKVKIQNSHLTKIMTTSANLTSLVKICSMIIGVRVREIIGNTFGLASSSLMWLPYSSNIKINPTTMIIQVNTISAL